MPTQKGRCFPPQLVTGLAVTERIEAEKPERAPTQFQVVRDLALDLRHALARRGRAPFVLSGLPMFQDLCAIRQTLVQCLALGENIYLRQWYTALDCILPKFQAAFEEITRALEWVGGIQHILDTPLPTAAEPGPSADAVARQLVHCLGQLADVPDLSPWLSQCRRELFALSERYWSGLFHCYDIVGLPATNNEHESLYAQVKRQLRRQRGISELREPLLRRGAWTILQLDVDSPAELWERLAQVSSQDYADERARYERRQEQFRRRYRWRHQRDVELRKRVTDWTATISDC